MFKAAKTFNILLFSPLVLILFSFPGTVAQVFAEEDVLNPSYNWTPQFYGKIKGESKLLYTRSFARSQLRFVDIDNDGDDDLFVGKADGRIAFFINQGDFSDPLFELQTEDFVVIHESLDEQNNPTLQKTVLDVGNNAAPEFADIDNDGDFDLSVSNNFICTPSGDFTLTFSNPTAGQSGNISLINSGGHTVSAHASVAINADILTALATAGTYHLAYYCSAASGNNTILVSASSVLT